MGRTLLSTVLALLVLAACTSPERDEPARTEPAGTPPEVAVPSRSQTTVSAEGGQILVNGTPTTLFGFRVASAALRDDWTDQLIAQLDTWRDHGANSLVLWLQGSSGGYTRVFSRDGGGADPEQREITAITGFGEDDEHTANGATTGTAVLERTRRIVEAADARGMVVIVGLFYRSAAEELHGSRALTTAARAAATAFRDCANVIFNVYNEPDTSDDMQSEDDLQDYLRAVHEAAPGRLAGTGTVDTDDSAEIAELDELDVLMHDSGSNGDESIAAFEDLKGRTGKPIINVESFGGSGQGFLDDPSRSVAARDGYYVDFPDWRRVYGAWRDEDYTSGSDGAIAGKDSYRRLIDHVGQDPGKQIHLMVHAAGWFQGASRVGSSDHLGAPGTPGEWNNAFEVGPGTADGTPGNPGIGWILDRIAAQPR